MDKNTKKHADRGWELMSQKLDLEMPQTRKKRGLGWLWPWAAGCLFLAGAGFFFLVKNEGSVGFANAEKSAGLVAKNLSEPSNEIAQVVDNQSVESRNLKNVAEGQDTFFEKNSLAKDSSEPEPSSQKSTQKGGSKSSFQPKNSTKIGEGEGSVFQKRFAPMISVLVEEKEISSEKNEEQNPPAFFEKKDVEKVFLKKIQPFEILPGRFFSPIIFDKKPAVPLKNPIKPIAKKMSKKWRLGIGLGVQTIDFQQLNGHSIGLACTRNLSKRTNLQTGLNWTRTILAPQPINEYGLCVLVEHTDYLAQTNDFALEFTDPSKSVVEFVPNPMARRPQITQTCNWPFLQTCCTASKCH